MPYIDPDLRPMFDSLVDDLICQLGRMRFKTGDLNYVLTRLAKGFLFDQALPKEPGYTQMSAVGGVLSDVRDEWYRRVMAPYEDLKIADNGDLLLDQGSADRAVEAAL